MEECFVLLRQCSIENANMRSEGCCLDGIIIEIESTSHGIKEGVSEVSCVIMFVSRVLRSIIMRYNLLQRAGGLGDSILNSLDGLWGLREGY